MSEELKSCTKRKKVAISEFEGQPVVRSRKLAEKKNLICPSRNLSKVAPHVLAPLLNFQTSHSVKVLFVISLSQSRDGVSGCRTQGAFSDSFFRGVVKQRKWTVNLGIWCRCICQGRRTSVHRCRKSSRVVQNVIQTAICEFKDQPVFRRRKLTDRKTSHFFIEICLNLLHMYSRSHQF